MKEVQLFCWKYCPYAHRAWLTAQLTNIDYAYTELNPYENRENSTWRQVSPAGKVPVMQFGQQTPGINESLVCMELIDEISGGKLMGSDPFSRAQTRLDAAQFDKEIVNMWYGYLMGKCEKDKFTEGWKNFLARFDKNKGPFFNGETELGFVDIVVLPWMTRMYCHHVHKHYNMETELTADEYYLYQRWCQAVHDISIVANTLQDKFENINMYGKYAEGSDYKHKSVEQLTESLTTFKC